MGNIVPRYYIRIIFADSLLGTRKPDGDNAAFYKQHSTKPFLSVLNAEPKDLRLEVWAPDMGPWAFWEESRDNFPKWVYIVRNGVSQQSNLNEVPQQHPNMSHGLNS